MPFCNPNLIVIPEGRFRNVALDSPSVLERAESIKEIGQLQPILVTKDMEVVDGATRLMACRRLSRDVWYVDEETGRLLLADPRLRKIAEYQANVQRADFTPAEQAAAIAEVHRLMQELYGVSKRGPGDDGWTMDDTAKKLGYKNRTTVSTAVTVAKAIESNVIPGLETAPTMSAAKKMVSDAVKIAAIQELAKRQTSTNDSEIENPVEFFEKKIILGDCVDKLKKLQKGICGLWVTDPPWKIDADQKVADCGSAVQIVQGCYDDSSEEILPMLAEVVKEMWRVSKDDAWVVMFCGIRHWTWLEEQFKKAGFSVYSKPLVWVRTTSDGAVFNAKSPAPTQWPASVTDFMVLAKKGNPTLYELNRGDAFLHPIIHPSKRVHHSQKPVGLLRQIISRIYHPGTNPLLIDPFAGSGATLVAARRCGIKQYLGYEKEKVFRDRAVAFLITAWQEEQKQVEEMDLDLDLDETEELSN